MAEAVIRALLERKARAPNDSGVGGPRNASPFRPNPYAVYDPVVYGPLEKEIKNLKLDNDVLKKENEELRADAQMKEDQASIELRKSQQTVKDLKKELEDSKTLNETQEAELENLRNLIKKQRQTQQELIKDHQKDLKEKLTQAESFVNERIAAVEKDKDLECDRVRRELKQKCNEAKAALKKQQYDRAAITKASVRQFNDDDDDDTL